MLVDTDQEEFWRLIDLLKCMKMQLLQLRNRTTSQHLKNTKGKLNILLSDILLILCNYHSRKDATHPLLAGPILPQGSLPLTRLDLGNVHVRGLGFREQRV